MIRHDTQQEVRPETKSLDQTLRLQIMMVLYTAIVHLFSTLKVSIHQFREPQTPYPVQLPGQPLLIRVSALKRLR